MHIFIVEEYKSVMNINISVMNFCQELAHNLYLHRHSELFFITLRKACRDRTRLRHIFLSRFYIIHENYIITV